MIGPLIESLRPKQWSKNLLLFAGLFFSRNVFHLSLVLRVVFGFVLFCLISGGVYLFNDLFDLKKDREHPVKSKRPLPSGRLSVSSAIVSSIILIGGGLLLSFYLKIEFGYFALSYVAINIAYSLILKHIVILDVILIAFGFVIRAVSGAVIIGVSISSWLLICTIFLALFLALCKRRHELVFLGSSAEQHRKILSEYSPELLDQMISVVTASTVMAYALYTMSAETVDKFGTRNLIFTIPFVIYGIFRYLYLVHQRNLGGSPELILLKDRSMIVNIALFLVVSGLIIYLK